MLNTVAIIDRTLCRGCANTITIAPPDGWAARRTRSAAARRQVAPAAAEQRCPTSRWRPRSARPCRRPGPRPLTSDPYRGGGRYTWWRQHGGSARGAQRPAAPRVGLSAAAPLRPRRARLRPGGRSGAGRAGPGRGAVGPEGLGVWAGPALTPVCALAGGPGPQRRLAARRLRPLAQVSAGGARCGRAGGRAAALLPLPTPGSVCGGRVPLAGLDGGDALLQLGSECFLQPAMPGQPTPRASEWCMSL